MERKEKDPEKTSAPDDAGKTKGQLIDELQSALDRLVFLEGKEKTYQALFEGIPDGIIIHDPEGVILDVNGVTCKRLGYTAEELRTMRLKDILAPEMAHQIGTRLPEALRGETVVYETVYVGRHGRIACEVLETAVDYEGRKALQSIARDLTERKHAEQHLAECDEKHRALFEDSLEAMSLVQDGKFTDVNTAWLKLHGFADKAEVLGTDVIGVIAPEDRPLFEKRRKERPKDVRRMYQIRDVRKGGAVFDAEVYSFSLPVEGKETIVSCVRDITDRHRAEREREQFIRMLSEYNLSLEKVNRELERSNRELDDFSHVVAHDLQEPLRMVTSYMDLLSKRYRDRLDKDADEFIGYAVNGASRMQKLINDLLSYAEVGKADKPPQRVNTEEALTQALENLKMAVAESHAVVKRDPLPEVTADEVEMVQLFQNLIGNAIKFRGEAPPQIHVSGKRTGNAWSFAVEDNGIGIEPHDVERIFGMFQRGHGKSKYPGSGIGLAVCKKIVERHGGRIWAESEVGKGSTFHFTIALTEEEKSKFVGKLSGPTQILLVEDNEGDTRLVQESIKDLKVKVVLHCVEDGQAAMDFVCQRGAHANAPRPDLVLLDLDLPKKNGHEVLAEIKAHRSLRDIPVAVLTKSREKSDILQSGNLHATWYVTKPVDVFQLLGILDAVHVAPRSSEPPLKLKD